MKMLSRVSKLSITALAVGLLVTGLTGCGAQKEVVQEAVVESTGLSEKVKDVLQKRADVVRNQIALNPRIIQLVRESNGKNKALSLAEIKQLDDEWMVKEGLDEVIQSFMTNEGAQILLEFQESHDGYPEIFIADATGLNVAMTNKTSDYYQADEEWWVQSYNLGEGRTFNGEIEYDESAKVEAIPLYMPIMDPDTSQAIGVLKVIIDITAIKMEL